MYRQITQLDDERQLTPGIGIYGETEGRFMDQGLQVILVGHLHGLIRRIDPLNRQLQRLSAADSTHGRSGSIDLLGFHA